MAGAVVEELKIHVPPIVEPKGPVPATIGVIFASHSTKQAVASVGAAGRIKLYIEPADERAMLREDESDESCARSEQIMPDDTCAKRFCSSACSFTAIELTSSPIERERYTLAMSDERDERMVSSETSCPENV